jgi:hypothetical protein
MYLGEILHDSPSPSPADDNKSTTYRQLRKDHIVMPELTAQTWTQAKYSRMNRDMRSMVAMP